jgi:hypothetical protein
MVGGSSSPSVRRNRNRPVRANRSTNAAWSLRNTNRREPRNARSAAARAAAELMARGSGDSAPEAVGTAPLLMPGPEAGGITEDEDDDDDDDAEPELGGEE